jgi:hypothetical protein
MTDTIEWTRGATLSATITWRDSQGALLDISAATPSIIQATQPEGVQLGVVITDVGVTTLTLNWPDNEREIVEFPHTTYIRVLLRWASGRTEATPRLQLNVN